MATVPDIDDPIKYEESILTFDEYTNNQEARLHLASLLKKYDEEYQVVPDIDKKGGKSRKSQKSRKK